MLNFIYICNTTFHFKQFIENNIILTMALILITFAQYRSLAFYNIIIMPSDFYAKSLGLTSVDFDGS